VRPRLLDLFCGAGGAGMGYHRAGFDVVGVDIAAQPHFPFEFHQADAMTYPLDGFDAIHASPPCQAWTHARHLGNKGRTDHPRLISPVRDLLRRAGKPYVIENVQDARAELVDPLLLCGSMFGLPIERHRLFELTVPVLAPSCFHGLRGPREYPGTPRADGTRPLSRVVNQMASGVGHDLLAGAMGIDWMPARGKRPSPELCEAIPPAYTEFIGVQLLAAVKAAA
jgi:DNA (cytosine-5)-methyltransferase 1